MTEIIIDNDQCSGCGLCVWSCPYVILELKDDADIASVKPELVSSCSHCGHCSAICPDGAISVTYPEAGPIPDFYDESLPSTGQISKLFTSRRSIRDYKKEKIPKEIFEQIIDIVRYAPTGMNGQSVNWLIIQDPEDVKVFAGKVIEWARIIMKEQPSHFLAPILPMFVGAWDQGVDKICHGAPHFVIAYGHKDNPVGFIDSVIALTHLDLAAPVFGLGTCWAGIAQIALDASPELMLSIGIPEDHKSHYAMMIGYPTYQFTSIPSRNAAHVLWK